MLTLAGRGECRRHADALLQVLDGTDAGSVATAALDHLEWCNPCSVDLEDLALALIALRRFGRVPADGQATRQAWPRLRARIERGRAAAALVAWRWRTTLSGLVAGTLIVAAVVGPMAVRLPLGSAGAEPVGYSVRELDLLGSRIEEAYVLNARAASPGATVAPVRSGSGLEKRYPDGMTPKGKEVPERTIVRPPVVD